MKLFRVSASWPGGRVSFPGGRVWPGFVAGWPGFVPGWPGVAGFRGRVAGWPGGRVSFPGGRVAGCGLHGQKKPGSNRVSFFFY